MSNDRTLIFQHLHRASGATLISILRRHYGADTTYRMDELRHTQGTKHSFEYFFALPQGERDKIKLLRGHMRFGLHAYFSHPCDYITIVRDPVERVLSEYTRLAMRSPDSLATLRSFEKLEGISLHDFVRSNVVAVNNYQTRV